MGHIAGQPFAFRERSAGVSVMASMAGSMADPSDPFGA
jgi:hypothetical protein